MLLPLVAPYFSHIVSIGGQNTCTDDIKLSTTGLSSFFPLSGKTSILETLLILKKSHFLISNDTGTLHL